MNTPTPNPETTPVDTQHPWLGLASFSEETRSVFFGREDEEGELSRRVQRKLLTVLFGQSGLGKTSLLRAGVAPRLRGLGYCPVYVRIDYGPQAPSAQEQIKQAILRETAASGTWTRSGIAAADESLWEFLHHRDDVLLDAKGKPVMPLLIIDQFEEIFTLAQGDDDGRLRAANFLNGLAELVENRPSAALEARLEEDDSTIERFDFARNDYRVLITLREDYLAHLESLKEAMPSITQNRLRLAPMTGTQALAAVTGPGGKLVSLEVAEAIVRFVAGGAELANAQVEPSLLSLICRELNDKRIAANRSEITLDLLAGSHASILTDFYERALADQPQTVRNVVEDLLLTDSGYRENVAAERLLSHLTAAGAMPDAAAVMAALVDRRLLRIEDRLDIRRVELTHDVLCSVVKESRALRHEREKEAINEHRLEEQAERERSTRQSLVKARRIIAGVSALSVVAVASAVFGYVAMRQAQDTRALADSSRNGAETLVSYLLDDFNTELAPVGRVDLVEELAKRTLSYYEKLPLELRNAATQGNHARALVRLAEAQHAAGRHEEDNATSRLAIALLEPLVASGSASETDQLSLASALFLSSGGANTIEEKLQRVGRAVALAAPFALAPKASVAARIEYARAKTLLGYLVMGNGDVPGGAKELQAAQAVTGDANTRQASRPLMMAYLGAGQWLHETMGRGKIKDYSGATVLAQELMAAANEVLRKYPNDKHAISLRDGVRFQEAAFTAARRHTGRAIKLYAASIQASKEVLLSDPADGNTIEGLRFFYGYQASAYARLGRPIEAKLATDNIWALYPSRMTNAHSGFALNMAIIHAELGEAKPLEKLRQRRREFLKGVAGTGESATVVEAYTLFFEAQDLVLGATASEARATPAALIEIHNRAEVIQRNSKEIKTIKYAKLAINTITPVLAKLTYATGDYVQSEKHSGEALNSLSLVDPDGPDVPIYRMEHALALARLKRLPEASALIKQALDVQRGLIANGADDQMLRFELAQSLFVSALTQPKAGGKELAEAAALIAKLPAALQDYRSVKLWRGRIDDEIRLNTRAALGDKAN